MIRAAMAALALLAAPAMAQNSFPTPGGATVGAYVNMRIVAGLAAPCAPSIILRSGGILPPCDAARDGVTATLEAADGAVLARLACTAAGWVIE
jgi:hypothetical protein